MKLSKLTKPELEEIFRNANFTEEEEKCFGCLQEVRVQNRYLQNFSSDSNRKQKSKKYKRQNRR